MQKLRNIPELELYGMNNHDKPEFIKKGQVVLAQNCLLGNNQIEKGPGAAQLFNIGINQKCMGGYSTDTEVYAAFNNAAGTAVNIYRWTGSGSPSLVVGASLAYDTPVEFVDTGTGVYVLNGVTATGKLVGATYTTPAGLPIGKFGQWYNNRLYISGNTTFKSRLYYSDLDTPDTFGGSSYIDIFPSGSSMNTGLGSIGGVLTIGKQNNIVTFNGYTEDNFTAERLTEQLPNFGMTSHRSIVNTGDDLLFMSFAADVPHIRSLKRTSFDKLNYGGTISDDIEGTMNRINKSRLDQVAGGFDGRYAWWAVPYESSTTNNYLLAYDTVTEGWTVHKGHYASVFLRTRITGNDTLCYGNNSPTGKILYLSKNTMNIDGEEIEFRVESRKYRPEVGRKCKFKYAYVTTGENTTTQVSVSGAPDGFTPELLKVVDSELSDGTFPMTFPFAFGISSERKHRVNMKGGAWYSYQLVFEETSSGTAETFPMVFPIGLGDDKKLIIKEWEILYFPRGYRDAN